jgi:hypothetical protein
MLTENGLEADRDAIREVLERADVVTVGFTTFAERLLIDTRADAQTGPMIAIVGPVATVQERYQWLGQHRGMFGAPQAFSFFVWPHTVRRLVQESVLEPLAARMRPSSPDTDATLHTALGTLLEREREAWRDAVRGGGTWQTLWARN